MSLTTEKLTHKVGPVTIEFWPDGDDPGTGVVWMLWPFGYDAQTKPGVSRADWDAFRKATSA